MCSTYTILITLGRFVILVDDICIFEFERGVSITSGDESFTKLGSVIMSGLVKVSVDQVDH